MRVVFSNVNFGRCTESNIGVSFVDLNDLFSKPGLEIAGPNFAKVGRRNFVEKRNKLYTKDKFRWPVVKAAMDYAFEKVMDVPCVVGIHRAFPILLAEKLVELYGEETKIIFITLNPYSWVQDGIDEGFVPIREVRNWIAVMQEVNRVKDLDYVTVLRLEDMWHNSDMFVRKLHQVLEVEGLELNEEAVSDVREQVWDAMTSRFDSRTVDKINEVLKDNIELVSEFEYSLMEP